MVCKYTTHKTQSIGDWESKAAVLGEGDGWGIWKGAEYSDMIETTFVPF